MTSSRPADDKTDIEADMKVLRLDEETRKKIRRHERERAALKGSEDFILLPENAEAFITFQKLCSQWRVGMSGYTGLDYTAVIAFLKLNFRKGHRELFADIQLIEMGVLSALRKSKGKASQHAKRV